AKLKNRASALFLFVSAGNFLSCQFLLPHHFFCLILPLRKIAVFLSQTVGKAGNWRYPDASVCLTPRFGST
ncbi:hypothetical protein, partial [Serratia marcescens]|uniref:hypothetical protein n=1 Tax=Serratia marcescens TaxID=615 RepID=UPI001C981BFD